MASFGWRIDRNQIKGIETNVKAFLNINNLFKDF
jgi:hypothetical protein